MRERIAGHQWKDLVMSMEWPQCEERVRRPTSDPGVTVRCKARATAPCGKCGKALCVYHAHQFNEISEETRRIFLRTLYLCESCVKELAGD